MTESFGDRPIYKPGPRHAVACTCLDYGRGGTHESDCPYAKLLLARATALKTAMDSIGGTRTHSYLAGNPNNPLDAPLTAQERLAAMAGIKSVTSTGDPNTKLTNPKDGVGSKKIPLWLNPRSALARMAMALRDGARKYGPYNWRTGGARLTIYLDAIERHHACLLDGEDLAADSLQHHLAHIMASCAIVLDCIELGNLNDDRPVKGNVAAIYEQTNKFIETTP